MPAASARTLALLTLLQSRRDWPGQVLAERLGISHRTVRRDVDRLRALGYRVAATKGPDGGYRLEAGSELPPLLFDDEQALALALALQTAPLETTGLAEATLAALTTVRQMMPSRLRNRMDALQVTAIRESPEGADNPTHTDTLLMLSTAVREHDIVRFGYADDDETRRAEPHRLLARQGRYYLLGWDLDREDWRTYRVDRIRPRTHVGPRFRPREIPGGDAAEFVAARFAGREIGGEWPCRGEVILETSVESIRPYLPEAVIDVLGPNRCRVTFGSWSWHGMVATLVALDADVTVIGPTELADAIGRVTRRLTRGD